MSIETVSLEIGGGSVCEADGTIRLTLPAGDATRYMDAQIDDTAGRARRHLRWRPPLELSLEARFSADSDTLTGTAGFGFWNVPFGPGLGRWPTLPQAVWFFFGAKPYWVPLAPGVPGRGWKAACLDALQVRALCWIPVAPLAVLAMQQRRIFDWLWPRIASSLGVREAMVQVAMQEWHHYRLVWQPEKVTFFVDGEQILTGDRGASLGGPLGFVAWMDNQYAIATPRGRFGWGLSTVPNEQWLEVASLEIRALP